MYHQTFAGNCIENPGDRCFDSGLGPDVFDCSGFILRVICDVTGQDVRDLANVRHVRDMWRAAGEAGNAMFQVADLATLVPGNLVVTRRIYDVDGEVVEMPGHIGIVTDASVEPPRFIHASTFNREGQVKERQMLTSATIIGAIAVDLNACAARAAA